MERSTGYNGKRGRVRRDPQFGYRSTMEHRPAYEFRRTARPPTTRAANVRRTLRVLRMSSGGQRVEAFTVPLLKINDRDIGYNSLERALGHIPNLWIDSVKSFKWEDRSLVKVSANELGHQWKGDFYMYKCTNPRSRLSINAHFDDAQGARIYGDAFVFVAEPDTFDMEYGSSYTQGDGSDVLRSIQRAAFVDVDAPFAESVLVHAEARKIVDELAPKEG